MNCMSCGALLQGKNPDYCPYCGSNVLVQRKVEYLSKLYYNQGLEKAGIRDLSGAIQCLQISLMFNKENIDARNLLGLVYFEMGEVVSALSEWVISKNLKKRNNLANEYISRLQSSPGKLEIINDSIRKYNSALEMCRKKHADMAAIQLKKVLSQNPKLIKGYHLLALLQMKEKSWNKARRTLRKAAKIDKTNTTTLRFLKEIDEQTGVTTKLNEKETRQEAEKLNQSDLIRGSVFQIGTDTVIQPIAFKERAALHTVLGLVSGLLLGAAAIWFLAVPSVRQNIFKEANQQIVEYGDYLVGQEAELTQIKGDAAIMDTSQDTEQYLQQIAANQAKCNSYQALLAAYQAMQDNNPRLSGQYIERVKPSTLSGTARILYENLCKETNSFGSEALYSGLDTEDIADEITGMSRDAEQNGGGLSGNARTEREEEPFDEPVADPSLHRGGDDEEDDTEDTASNYGTTDYSTTGNYTTNYSYDTGGYGNYGFYY